MTKGELIEEFEGLDDDAVIYISCLETAIEHHLAETTIWRKIEMLRDKGIVIKRKYERW